jgi:hypothetical protein
MHQGGEFDATLPKKKIAWPAPATSRLELYKFLAFCSKKLRAKRRSINARLVVENNSFNSLSI